MSGLWKPCLSQKRNMGLTWTPSPISGPQGPAGTSLLLISHSQHRGRARPRELGTLGPGGRAALGPGEHCQLWRGSRLCDHLWRVGRRGKCLCSCKSSWPYVAADGTPCRPAHLVLGSLLPRPGFKADPTLCSIRWWRVNSQTPLGHRRSSGLSSASRAVAAATAVTDTLFLSSVG